MKYTIENLPVLAKTCKTKIEFKKKYPAAIRAAKNFSIYESICSHMVSGRGKWNKEKVRLEAKKFNSRWEFQKNSKGAYLYCFANNFLDEVCSHMSKNLSILYKHKEDVVKFALLCNTRTEFKTKYQGAYLKACKGKFLDEVCSHMNHSCYPWTNEELLNLSKLYKSRTEFRNNNFNAYSACIRRKITDKAFSHMKLFGGTSSIEINIFEIIKSLYPKSQKLKDKVNIEGKPHIHRFELDVYVPELRKAIEFDGKYHHSFEGLKRGHPGWPDEDLKNYHDIKDDWFSSKGVEILHIKEKDWKKDKEDCVNRCLEFLNIPIKEVA